MTNADYKSFVREAVKQCVLKANKKYNLNLTSPFVEFDVKSSRIFAETSALRQRISFNLRYVKQFFKDTINDTIPHEVAHIVVSELYPNAKAHGSEWRGVCKALGGVPKSGIVIEDIFPNKLTYAAEMQYTIDEI